MSRTYFPFKLFGLQISFHTSAIISFVVLWVVLTILGILLIKLSIGEALLGGFLATIVHYISELVHNFGHALAAHRTGHPMIGIRFFFVLAGSVYPRDEGDLPARIHIRRALGGPIISFLFTAFWGIILGLMEQSGGMMWWVIFFAFIDNLFVYAIGSLLPIRFGNFSVDGATILYWWPRR